MTVTLESLHEQTKKSLATIYALLDKLDLKEARRGKWTEVTESLLAKELPETIIALCGETGAGKSSLLNALLEGEFLPTSGQQACTATVIETRYHEDSHVEGEVFLLNREECQHELAVSLKDIQQLDEQDPRGDDPGNVSRAKLSAVFPNMNFNEATVETLMNELDAHNALVDKVVIREPSAAAFAEKLSLYVRAGLDHEREYWPLVKRVCIRCNAAVLKTGVVLVDLPGSGDSNAARAAVADQYMQTSSFFFVAAPIIRAVSNRTAADLLEKRFRLQLQLDGNYTAEKITFIATKIDGIRIKEAVSEYNLANDEEYKKIDADVNSSKDQVNLCTERKRALKTEMQGMKKSVEKFEHFIERVRKDSNSAPSTLKRKDNSSSASGMQKRVKLQDNGGTTNSHLTSQTAVESDNTNEGDGSAMVDELHCVLKEKKDQLAKVTESFIQNADDLLLAQTRHQDACIRRASYCIKRRSQQTTEVLQTQFQKSLPSVISPEARLPVFSCSSRAFMAMTFESDCDEDERNKEFCDVAETGIPALQEWCHNLGRPARRLDLGVAVEDTIRLIRTVQSYLADDEQSSANDVKTIATKCKNISKRLIKHFEYVTSRFQVDLVRNLRKDLDNSLHNGVNVAIDAAEEAATRFACDPHWRTYRAALTRSGAFRDRDLNLGLVEPMMNALVDSGSWLNGFRLDALEALERRIRRELNVELKAITSLADSVSIRVEKIIRLCFENADASLQKANKAIQAEMNRRQKASSRLLSPHIQHELSDTYVNALEIVGRGSVKLQQQLLIDKVNTEKAKLLDGAAERLKREVDGAPQATTQIMQKSMERLARKIELLLADIWEAPQNTKGHVEARENIKVLLQTTEEIKRQISHI